MEISNLDIETRPSCQSFHYISTSKNINFTINNNDENKDDNTIANVDSSNINNNADNLAHEYTAFFNMQSSIYIPRLNFNKTKQRFSPTNLLSRIFQKFEYICLNKNRNSQYWNNYEEKIYFFHRTFSFNRNEENSFEVPKRFIKNIFRNVSFSIY